MSPILLSPYIKKALTSFMVTYAPCGQQKPSGKNICLIAWTLPSPKSCDTDLLTCLFGAVSQSYLGCYLPGCSPHFASNETCVSHVVWFFQLSSSHKRIQNRGCGWILMDHPYSLNHLDKHAKILPSGPTLWDPLNCSPPDSSIHGILQARIMEWVAISSSRGSPQPRGPTGISCISCIGSQILYH